MTTKLFPRKINNKNLMENNYLKKNIHQYIVFYANIDKFQYINDNYGHSIGDILLEKYGQFLRNLIGNYGIVFKFYSDEFIIFINKNRIKSIDFITRKMQKRLCKLFKIQGYEIIITSSIGIYQPAIGENLEEVIRKAYIALHKAKKQGGKKLAFYTGQTEENIQRKAIITKELNKSLINGMFNGFTIVYQPIYSIKKKRIEEVESLIRWENSILGNVSPSEFIPIAEETGIMQDLGYWIIKKVIKQIKEWEKEGIKLKVAINISPKEVEENNFLNNIKKLIEREKINYNQIKFEITETQILSLEEENLRILKELKQLGVDISIDDFGEGYSSIKNMIFLPINEIKIDKKFVEYIHIDEKIELLVTSLILFAHKVGYKVTAEGVEYKEQFIKLVECGCDSIQGYFISRPIQQEEVKTIMENIKL